jgi:hypothetical protein
VFQNSKCALSGAALELPVVHFMCGHSFNLRSLGENDRECPLCAPGFRAVLDIKRRCGKLRAFWQWGCEDNCLLFEVESACFLWGL